MLTEDIESKKKHLYAASKNKEHIAEVLLPRIQSLSCIDHQQQHHINLLEIASGTGEHGNWVLSKALDCNLHITYQPTEMDGDMFESIRAWLQPFPDQALQPVALNINQCDLDSIPTSLQPIRGNVDVMLCINMIHISPFESTINLFRIASECLQPNGFLMTYGAYRVNGYMVESNVAFDASLKSRNPEWGVRDLERVEEAAKQYGMQIKETIEMPSNNLSVIFVKTA